MSAQSAYYSKVGEACFNKVDKINAEVFALTYGALVVQLVRDYEDIDLVNDKLDQMGYNIGIRLIDDFLAKSGLPKCANFKDTAEALCSVGFKMFLNTSPKVKDWDQKGHICKLEFSENPLEMFVELPETCTGLKYCNMLCGVVRGALESISLDVECKIVSDVLQGDSKTVLELTLKNVIDDATGEDYKED